MVGADVGTDDRGTWLSRAVKLGIGAITAASLGLAGLLVPWSDLLSSGPPQPHVSPEGTVSWEAEGWVKSAAPPTSSIRVSSGFLGLSSLTVIVPLDTLIMVAGKEGGFDDLHEGRRVRAIYEARPTGLHAKSIEVLVEGAQPHERRPSGSVAGTGSRPSPLADAPLGTEKVALPAKLAEPPVGAPSPPSTTRDTRSPAGAAVRAAKPADGQTKAHTSPSIPADMRKSAPAAKPTGGQAGARTSPPTPAEMRNSAGIAPSVPKPADLRSAVREAGPRAIPSATRVAEPESGRSPRDESSIGARRATVPPIPPNEGSPRAGSAEPRRTPVSDPGSVIDWLLRTSPNEQYPRRAHRRARRRRQGRS